MMVIDQMSAHVVGRRQPRPVGTWSGAPQLTETNNLPPSPLTNATLRQLVHISVGGSQVRAKFSERVRQRRRDHQRRPRRRVQRQPRQQHHRHRD
jgi:hypothetical protein